MEYMEYPVSQAQKRMYLLDFVAKTSGYDLFRCIRLFGRNLDYEKMQRTLKDIIWHREILRTTFHIRDGRIKQSICDEYITPLELVDLRELCVSMSQEQIKNKVYECIKGNHLTFDVNSIPLFKMTLYRIRDDDYVLYSGFHHIIADAISVDIFFIELLALYNGTPLQSMTWQYKDYASWEEKFIGEISAAQKDFWLDMYNGFSKPSFFPACKQSSCVQPSDTKQLTVGFGNDLSIKIHMFARSLGVTSFTLILSVFSLLLSKKMQTNDLVLGMISSGRYHPHTEGMIGVFIQTLAIRYQIECDMQCKQYIKNVGSKVFNAIDNQYFTFEMLLDSLKLHRTLNKNRLFNVVINHQPFNEGVYLQGDELQFAPFIDLDEQAVVDMEVFVYSGEDNMDITLRYKYRSDMYEDATIEKLYEDYVIMLENVINNAEAHVGLIIQ